MAAGSNVPNSGPLAGLKVLDLSRILAGPTCTQLLGDYGADVLKIERPGAGDDTRSWGPPYVTGKDGTPTSESAYYLSANRNKRSVAVDIATEEGAAKIRALARHCDVIIENFKVGGLAKYGLDHASMLNEHPALIYCSITGFGQTGPNAARPGYDLLAQGYGGIMSITGEAEGEPMKVGVGVADVVCGLYACTAILAALRHRDATGQGQHIDIGLVDSQISWLVNQGASYLTSGEEPRRLGNQHPTIVPYQVFATSDGHIIVAVGNDGQFARFCTLIGMEELSEDERFRTNVSRVNNRDILVPILSEQLMKLKKAELIDGMEQNNIPGGAINTLPEVFVTEQVKAREMKISVSHATSQSGTVDLIGNPVKFSKTPVSYRRGPPVCGEHTDEVLDEYLGESTGGEN
ncbi:MAG: CaiB/BaiF CoA-transferase family protein [Pseudomonadota bacterium]